MKQSSLRQIEHDGIHVAIIMDGNGRWAAARGLPRTAGHRAGAEAVRRTLEATPDCGIRVLTLYAFSADNWRRPKDEVSELMKLLRTYLLSETSQCVGQGIRLNVIGRRDRLSRSLRLAIETAEAMTAKCHRLHLRIAVDYSSRDTILRATARQPGQSQPTREEFARLLGAANHESGASPDVDLVIRTSGEQRLSDFLLWECAYAELCFTKTLWPDFGQEDLQSAVHDFYRRDRRFGQIIEAAAS